MTVHHPRYPVIPRVGMSLAPALLYAAMLPFLRRLLDRGLRVDAIDAHYVYPDGVAAVWLGQKLGLPVVVTARGTDVNLIPAHAVPRRLIRSAAAGAAALVAVSAALKTALTDLGVPAEKVTVLRNGVDITLFRPPADRQAARAALGLAGPTVISVGALVERKGHHLAIEALRDLPDWTLLDRRRRPGAAEIARAHRPAGAERPRPSAGTPAARRTAGAVRCGGCARAGVLARRMGQRAAGIHGLRHARGGHQYLGQSGGRADHRRRADRRAQCPGNRRGRSSPRRCAPTPCRDPCLCRGVQLG